MSPGPAVPIKRSRQSPIRMESELSEPQNCPQFPKKGNFARCKATVTGMKTRILSMLLCLVMVLSVLPLTLWAAKDEDPSVKTLLNLNFDKLPVNEDYVDTINNEQLGMSFLSIPNMMITRDDAIKTKSARIKTADMRWWGTNWVEDYFQISYSVKYYEGSRNLHYLYIVTTDAQTWNEWILYTDTYEDAPVLLNHEKQTVYKFEYGKQYDITLDIKRGSDTYDILVNGELVCDDAKFISPISAINSFGWWFLDCDLMFDEFTIKGHGRILPAKNSMQATGPMPEIDYPDAWVDTGEYRVYHNTVRQDFAQTDIAAVEGDVWLNAAKVLPLVKGDAVVTLDGDNKTAALDGKTVDLTPYLSVKNDMEMISLSAINKIFGAKVWFDEVEHMIILTTGSYMSDNFLRACGYKFVMNGEPYYELSFNKHNMALNLQAYFFGGRQDESILQAEEQVLKTLSENGFKSIRVFINNPWGADLNTIRSEEGKKNYYDCMDYLFDLCDKYGIRIIACLILDCNLFSAYDNIDGVWVNTSGDIEADIIATPESASRKFVYSYLDEFIGRYKDRDTVLMWEVSNEINLDIDLRFDGNPPAVSALQLGDFYADITEYINAIDKNHLVDSGDAGMRNCQYHLLLDTMAGNVVSWGNDTQEEHNKALWIINHGINVISTHASEPAEYFENYMNCSRAWDKPLYVGETGDMLLEEGQTWNSPEILADRQAHLDKMVNTGIQLMTWWDYNEGLVSLEGTPTMFQMIADANRALQKKWVVNGVKNATLTPDTCLFGDKVPFTDVPEDAWYYNDVLEAFRSGLVNGTSATTYEPSAELVYSAAVKLAACMNQKTYEGNVTLTVGNPWYQPYVDYASANGIIAGEYDWNAKATRAGYLSIFANALKDEDLAPINEVPDGSIPDVPMTHPQAEAIYKLYRAGIIQGTDEAHSCSPDTNISRSEMAAILTRMMDATKRVTFTMG